MKELINKLLIKISGFRLINNNVFNYYLDKSNSNSYEFLLMVKELKGDYEILNSFYESKSQILQDLFVLIKLDFLKKGFFVEFGSTDGVSLSNTYLLENRYEWNGILVEPSKKFHKKLNENRKCIIDKRCVYSKSGELVMFNEVEIGELSTIDSYSSEDGHSKNRKKGIKYEVETVSLLDLLIENDSPKVIEYLSIDTEGSEYEILNSFDFSKFKFKIITVEHNYINDKRDLINKLLEKNGYKRVYENLSKWDDWYVNTEFKSLL
jgi:FkbM family methyltransferase